jgi:hypothetical protein
MGKPGVRVRVSLWLRVEFTGWVKGLVYGYCSGFMTWVKGLVHGQGLTVYLDERVNWHGV